ncbi:hypothetical protein EUX98_g4387 [Antrodiella citrinella]|uniref:Uncharacterized protein n=1 Tax=Antrodiella citrinella TaxID=2447956 RepID=A0A4V3XIN2_9APHY|nr:hypothetical protein EUX98_g4387 [Antrodiella citrinella]
MQIDLSQGKGTSIRPLPSPSPHPEYNAFRPLPIRTDSLYPHSSCRSPTLNLILDFKSTHAPMEFVLESPVGPISPITFDSDESQKHRRNQEDRLAIRLSAFGFVEVPESSPDGCSDEDAVFLVEEEPLSKGKRNSKRYSRKWVREKKGKRFVEEDYTRVIESLRRL